MADNEPQITMDANQLFREDMFTDLQAGSIRRLTPVKPDGSDDPDRKVIYVGQAQVMTPMGTLPLTFELGTESLADAVARFPKAAEEAMERTRQELQELRREAASSIIVPGQGGGGAGGPGGMGGGPGGFQMP
ncbi:MAG: hypothetical protein P8Y64_10320 [Gammaproteobacteria bacterium]